MTEVACSLETLLDTRARLRHELPQRLSDAHRKFLSGLARAQADALDAGLAAAPSGDRATSPGTAEKAAAPVSVSLSSDDPFPSIRKGFEQG